MSNNKKILYISTTILFIVMLSIGMWDMYKNTAAQQKELQENYIKTEAAITYVGKTGTGYRTRTLLFVTYFYDNQNYNGKIYRAYKREGYYTKGDQITININPNNPKDIR